MMAFCPEHPKWDQNLKFTPLSKTTSIPTPFICGVPPPPPGLHNSHTVSDWYVFHITPTTTTRRYPLGIHELKRTRVQQRLRGQDHTRLQALILFNEDVVVQFYNPCVTVRAGQAYQQDCINEFIIWRLNPLVVVNFSFIFALLHM